MTKSELIQRITKLHPHLLHRDAEMVVNTVFDTISKALAGGNRVELRGFGAFSVRQRKSRLGRNPKTGESVHVDSKNVPFFKCGKQLHSRLNGEQSTGND